MRDGTAIIATLALMIAIGYGYFNNLYELAHTDFESPYKAEVYRTVGVFVPPVGVILGYIDIED